MRTTLLAALGLALLAPAARASGGGAGPVWGGAGATAPGRSYTYIALPNGEHGSLIEAVRRDGGGVDRWKLLPRPYGVPQVGMDGTTTGLSADGRVLVLAALRPYLPVGAPTRLLVLQARTFRPLGRFSFPGRYSVQAVSPHGRYVYLRRYTASMRTPWRSELVVLDRAAPAGPRVLGGQTEGIPSSHASDGRWAYTLFQGKRSWVQGLDTVTGGTRRWEIPSLRGNDLTPLRLEGNRLHVGAAATLTVGPRGGTPAGGP